MRRVGRLLAVACITAGVGMWKLPAARADERTDARRAFRAGMQAVADGRYDEGIAQLERAYETLPHPNVLYNIGLAHMYAGRAEEAIEYLERYKESANAAETNEVDAILASLRGAASERAAVPVGATEPAPGAGSDVASAVATAAREVRKIATDTGNDALKLQADELDRMAAGLRGKEAVPSTGVPAPAMPAISATEAGAKPKPPAAATNTAARGDTYEEKVVSASRFAQSPLDAPNATAIITAQDIRMTGLTSIPDLLRRVAGVDVATVSPAHAEVSMRGLNRRQANKVLFLVDGRPRRLDFLGSSWFDQVGLATEDIERIEIIRGPASALYGADAFSGIVNVITRAPGEGRSFVVGGVGTEGRGRAIGSFTGREGKLSYHFGAGHDQTNQSTRVVGMNRVDVQSLKDPNRAYVRTWGNGELRYEVAPGSTLSVGNSTVYGNTTVQGLSRLLQVTSANSLLTNTFATLTLPKGFKVATWWDHVSGNAGPSVYAPAAIDIVAAHVRQDLADADLSWSGRFKLLVPQNLTVGGNYRYKHTDWVWFDGAHTQHHFGAYVQDVIELARPLTLQLGARVDRHPLLSSIQFSPRGSLVYRFLQNQSLRASVGRAFRGPSFLESYLHQANGTPLRGVNGLGIGNNKLDPENIVSYELGYQNQASDYVSLEANVYFNTVKDLILFTDVHPFTLAENADGAPLSGYDPGSRSYPISTLSFTNERPTYRQVGTELGVRVYPVTGLDLYANYAIQDTAPMHKSTVDPVRARERTSSMHKVNGGVQYRSPIGLDASADVSWLSKQLWAEQVVDLDSGGVRFQAFNQPWFVMVNGRIGYRLWDDRVDLGVVGTNLAFQNKRQHPFGQPIDTRVLGTAKLRF